MGQDNNSGRVEPVDDRGLGRHSAADRSTGGTLGGADRVRRDAARASARSCNTRASSPRNRIGHGHFLRHDTHRPFGVRSCVAITSDASPFSASPRAILSIRERPKAIEHWPNQVAAPRSRAMFCLFTAGVRLAETFAEATILGTMR
jgi:hypothetical protein